MSLKCVLRSWEELRRPTLNSDDTAERRLLSGHRGFAAPWSDHKLVCTVHRYLLIWKKKPLFFFSPKLFQFCPQSCRPHSNLIGLFPWAKRALHSLHDANLLQSERWAPGADPMSTAEPANMFYMSCEKDDTRTLPWLLFVLFFRGDALYMKSGIFAGIVSCINVCSASGVCFMWMELQPFCTCSVLNRPRSDKYRIEFEFENMRQKRT